MQSRTRRILTVATLAAGCAAFPYAPLDAARDSLSASRSAQAHREFSAEDMLKVSTASSSI
jgi:hypothetical protein